MTPSVMMLKNGQVEKNNQEAALKSFTSQWTIDRKYWRLWRVTWGNSTPAKIIRAAYIIDNALPTMN